MAQSGGQEFVATIVDGRGKLGFKLAQQRVPGDFYAFVVEQVDAGGAAERAGILKGAQLLAVNNRLVVFAGNKAVDFYGVLGVERDAPRAAIRKAYLAKALELHPDRASARGEAPGTGGDAFVLISEAYATLADESHRASYDAMRGCKGCCVELGDVVKMIRRGDGPCLLRFFEPAAACEMSDARTGSGAFADAPPVASADAAAARRTSADASFYAAAAPSMSRLSWIGGVAQRASAGDVDAVYKLGVDHALRVADDWPAPDVARALGHARKCLDLARRSGDARAAHSLKTLDDGANGEDVVNDGLRFAAAASPLATAAVDGDPEAQLLVAIALIRINTAGERLKALENLAAAAGNGRPEQKSRESDAVVHLIAAEAAYLAGLVHLALYQDPEARDYLEQASKAGHPYAKDRLKALKREPRPARGACCCRRRVDPQAKRFLLQESYREWERIRVYAATAAPTPRPRGPPPEPKPAPKPKWTPPQPQPAPPPAPPPEPKEPPSPLNALASFLFCDAGALGYGKAINGLVCGRDGHFSNMICFSQGSKTTQIHANEEVLEDIEYAWNKNTGHQEIEAAPDIDPIEADDTGVDDALSLIPVDFDRENFDEDNPLQLTEQHEAL